MRTAEEIGRELTGLGLQLLTSGKSGVMEAASKGALEAGDLPVGILPDEDWTAANPYVAVPIATGLGPARNAVIARVCEVLIAVGGEYGTLARWRSACISAGSCWRWTMRPRCRASGAAPMEREAIERTATRVLRLDGFERKTTSMS